MKKKFKCGHKGYGKYCHTCSPWPKRTSDEQLKRLDEKGYKATKERKKLAKRKRSK